MLKVSDIGGIKSAPLFEHRSIGKAQSVGDQKTCLLYTSDAADERSSVDLGGRRIIKKKKTQNKGVVVHKHVW